MKITPIFRWYDFYVGFYWSRADAKLYFFPFPMFGLVFEFKPHNKVKDLPIGLPRDTGYPFGITHMERRGGMVLLETDGTADSDDVHEFILNQFGKDIQEKADSDSRS